MYSLYCASFCQIAVQLVMPKLVSADNPLHLTAQVFVYEDKTAALDHPIHPFQRAEVLTEQDFDTKLPCYAKRISRPAALYKSAADLREIFSIHRLTSR